MDDIYDCDKNMPYGIQINTDENNWSLYATTDFNIGNIVFNNTSQIIPDAEKNILIKFGSVIKILDKDHFLQRDDYKEFLGFDSFMNHSCDPNTETTYYSRTDYTVKAIKHIFYGDTITCDYNLLDNLFTNQKSVVTIDFDCNCGMANCRGKIYA